MKFTTTLNSSIVQVEYDEFDAIDADGVVDQIKVWFNTINVTSIVSDDDYADLQMESTKHFEDHCKAERTESEMFRAECKAASIGHGVQA